MCSASGNTSRAISYNYCILLGSAAPFSNNFDVLFVADVWGRLGGYLGDMFGEVLGTCLGGLGDDVERFLDRFR